MTFYFILLPTMFFVACAIGQAALDVAKRSKK